MSQDTYQEEIAKIDNSGKNNRRYRNIFYLRNDKR